MSRRGLIKLIAGLLLSQLLSVVFAQGDIDCRRRAADAFAYTRQVAGQSHDAKRWAETLNQQLLKLGISRESFRRCLPEGDVVLRKMEQCARNNDRVCAFTEKEVEEGNQEIKQRARERAEAEAELRARQQPKESMRPGQIQIPLQQDAEFRQLARDTIAACSLYHYPFCAKYVPQQRNGWRKTTSMHRPSIMMASTSFFSSASITIQKLRFVGTGMPISFVGRVQNRPWRG